MKHATDVRPGDVAFLPSFHTTPGHRGKKNRCIETTQVLLDLEADADTLLAALATHFLGLDSDSDTTNDPSGGDTDADRSEKLAVIRSQCGPIVYQIVRDGARLGGIFRPPPEATRFRRDVHGYQALLDLDHHNAQLARWVGKERDWGRGEEACVTAVIIVVVKAFLSEPTNQPTNQPTPPPYS